MAGEARQSPTVYVVEDNPTLLQGLRRALTANGYVVRAAHDGASAVGMLGAPDADPDLLLLDLMMPRMSGIDVLQAVRRDPRWTHLPVILITAATQEELVAAGVGSDELEVLFKPFRLQDLLDRVAGRVGR